MSFEKQFKCVSCSNYSMNNTSVQRCSTIASVTKKIVNDSRITKNYCCRFPLYINSFISALKHNFRNERSYEVELGVGLTFNERYFATLLMRMRAGSRDGTHCLCIASGV